jgi:hypothetical protein
MAAQIASFDYQRKFNIMDASHDAQATKTIGGVNVKNTNLFKDVLTLLFDGYDVRDNPYFVGNEEEYSINVPVGHSILDPYTNTVITQGQRDNLLPEKFLQESIQTLSQIYDSAAKTYLPAKPSGFKPNTVRMITDLTPYGFNGWCISARWKDQLQDAPPRTKFNLYHGLPRGPPADDHELNFMVEVTDEGWYHNGNHTDPNDADTNYIRGNTEKNRAINTNNNLYTQGRGSTQADLITLVQGNTGDGGLLNSAAGRVASKVVGDLWHMIDKPGHAQLTVHTSDNYLAKRAAYMRYPTVLRRQKPLAVWYLYFPGGNGQLAAEAHNRSNITGGVRDELVKYLWEGERVDAIGWFGCQILEHTRVNNKGPIHIRIVNNQCTGGCNRTSTEATCYTNDVTGEGVILAGARSNGVYRRTRSHTGNPHHSILHYTDEYLVSGFNRQLVTIEVILICLCIAMGMLFARREGGGDKTHMKENVSKQSDMNLNQQKLYLSSEYDKYIQHLSNFLTSKKVRISGEKEEECPARIVTYITNVIAMFIAHKESALKLVKTDEDIFRWVPSQIIFHTSFMTIPQYTEDPVCYAPLKVHKLFPHLDDATVSSTFNLENKFGVYSTFYDFFTGSKDERPAYVIPDTPLVFKELLIFLDGEYSDKKKVYEMTDEIPTNFGDGGVKFAEQIRWFQDNGVTRENYQIFADLLADTMSRQCISETQIAPIIFRELAKGDIILGYTLYNQCYPHLFASTKYFVRFDIYADLVHQLNSSGEIKHDLLHGIESKIQQDYANRLLKHATELANKMGITTVESLYTYCKSTVISDEDLDAFRDTVNELLAYPSGAAPVFLEQFSTISNQICRIIEGKNKQRVYPKPEKSVEKNPIITMKFKRPEEESPEEESPEEESPEEESPGELPPPPPPRLLKISGHGGRKTVKRIKKHSKRVNNKHKKPTRRKTVKRKR